MKVSLANMDVNLLGTEVKVGDVFPNFKAVDSELGDFEFYSLPKGKKLVLSVPSIDTGTCDIETTKFMNHFKDQRIWCSCCIIRYTFWLKTVDALQKKIKKLN
nr:redoxin family protein [Mycoplasmopsis bovis]